MNKLLKWFKCFFITKCRKQKKWKMNHMGWGGAMDLECKECGKCKYNVR